MTYEQWKDVAQFVIIPIIGYATWLIRSIRGGIRNLNERMVDMERWRRDYEGSQSDKHVENVARLGRIEGIVEGLRYTERRAR